MEKLKNEQMKIQLEAQKLSIEAQKVQGSMMNEQAKGQVSAFEAETDRINTQIKAEQAGATIDHTQIKSFGDQLDNQKKMSDMMEEQMMKAQIPMMSEAELINLANRR